MADPAAVLDSIDGALRDYETSADAMRWSPDPDSVQAEPDYTELYQSMASAFENIAISITVIVAPFVKALNRAAAQAAEVFAAAYHPVLAAQDRRHRIRCATCNPAGNPPPFPGGAEYHRRRKARARRRRR